MCNLKNTVVSIALMLTVSNGLSSAIAQDAAPTRPIAGKLSSTINVSGNSGRSIFPVIRAGREGSVHVVWADDSPGNFDIFYARWNGTKWSNPTNLSNNERLSLHPRIAIDSIGQVHVTWMDGDAEGESDILHSQLVESVWSTPRNISNLKGVSQRPQIEVDATGAVHIIWYANPDGSFELFHCQLVDSAWSQPANTDLVDWYITHNPFWTMTPAITLGTRGHVHLVWVGLGVAESEYARTQNVRHSRWDGKNWSRPENVSRKRGMVASLKNPGVASDAQGNLHFVWDDRGTVWYCRFDDEKWSRPEQIDHANRESAYPTVCASEGDRLHFAWVAVTQGEPQVFYRQLDGQGWSSSVTVSEGLGTALCCTLAFDEAGTLHMTGRMIVAVKTKSFTAKSRRISDDP